MSADTRATAMTLDPAERSRLLAIAGHLIPAAHGMPSAADVVDDERLGFVLGARPDLAAPLHAALRADLGNEAAARLAALERDAPGIHGALLFVIVGAYYTDARVRELLGYPGQRAIDIESLPPEPYLAEGLVDQVLARGPIWKNPATGRRAERG
jgi:hypothetical protein